MIMAVAVAAVSLLPVAYLLIREGLDLGNLRRVLQAPATTSLIRNTFLLAFWVTFSSVLLGVSLAVIVVRTAIPGRRAWMVLFTLPLGIPAFVATYTWVAAGYEFAPRSTFIYGLRGASIILTLSLYPYVYLPTVAALRGLDASQENVARALGRGPFRTFLEVTLPQLRRAISSGALIIALHMLAEFGALELLRYRTLTTSIVQRATVLGSPESARVLSIFLTVGALLLLAGDYLLFRSASAPVRTGSGAPQEPARWRPGAWSMPLMLVSAAVVVASLGVPLYGIFTGLANVVRGSTDLDTGDLLLATWKTSEYAALTALVVTIAALPISLLVVRFPGRAVLLIERAAWVAHSLPGVIVALGLVFVAVRWMHPFYQSSALLVLGYSILYLPIAVGAQRVGIEQASASYDRIARTLGHTPVSTFVRVTLPIAMPGIIAGIMLVILNVAKELTMTLLLRPTGAQTLATQLWATTNGEVLDFSAAAPYATIMLVMTAIPTYLLIRTSLSPARQPSA